MLARTFAAVLIATLIGLSPGCKAGSSDKTKSRKTKKVTIPPKPKQDPKKLAEAAKIQQRFNALNAAVNAKQHSTILAFFSEDSQKLLVGAFVIGAKWRAAAAGKTAELQSLLEPHGLKVDQLASLPDGRKLPADRKQLNDLAQQIGGKISNRSQCFADLYGWLAQNIAADTQTQLPFFDSTASTKHTLAEIEVFKTEAEANLTTKRENVTRRGRITFVKENDQWVIDLLQTDPPKSR